MEKFWIVVDTNLVPVAKAPTAEKAKEGAAGFARAYDSPFIVLEAMEVVTPQQTPVEWKAL